MFNQLYKLGNCVNVSSDDERLYCCAATGGNEGAIIVTHYDDDNNEWRITFKINIDGFGNQEGVELEFYIVDENCDLELFRTEIFTGDKYAPVITLPVQSSIVIKMKR